MAGLLYTGTGECTEHCEVLAKASTRRTSVVKAEHQGYEGSAKHEGTSMKNWTGDRENPLLGHALSSARF